jgi:zinc transport system ATP-binding protein
MSLIKVKDLSVKYGNNKIIENLSFNVDDGDILCIVGPNGSGKSTLLKAIIGEIKPNKGSIKFEQAIKQNHIGYLPQHAQIPDNFPATAYEIVSTGVLNQTHFVRKEHRTIIEKALKTLKIENLKKRSYSELSGGQRQKVLLARALCSSSKILILDEASNNLDYNSKTTFYETLKSLNKKEHLTIIMVTHDLDHNNLLGNKILSIDKDNPFFGTTEDYVRRVHAH